jgi:hypothetical protein
LDLYSVKHLKSSFWYGFIEEIKYFNTRGTPE